MTTVQVETIPALVERTDGVRSTPLPAGPDATWQKEWFHFAILGPGVHAILNFSATGDTRPAAAPGGRLFRTILLVHDGAWSGGVDTIPARDATFGPGLHLRLGQNTGWFDEGRFLLSSALEREPVGISVTARPVTRPLLLASERALKEGWISWAVIPRLVSRGSIVVGRRVHRLERTLLYHDHNWGRWLWGHDFSWEWGFGLPDEPTVPWSLVFDRTSDRARARASALTLAVWKGATMVHRFRPEEIRVHPEGRAPTDRVRKFPPVMALIASALTTDVPARLHVEADAGRNRLALAYEVEDLAQIVVPNETDLGVTVINETVGRVRAEGTIHGDAVRMEGRGHFEFLRS